MLVLPQRARTMVLLPKVLYFLHGQWRFLIGLLLEEFAIYLYKPHQVTAKLQGVQYNKTIYRKVCCKTM